MYTQKNMELVHSESKYKVGWDMCIPKLMLRDWMKDKVKQLSIIVICR